MGRVALWAAVVILVVGCNNHIGSCRRAEKTAAVLVAIAPLFVEQ